MKETIKVTATFPVSSKKLYEAWLSSKEHSHFIEGNAEIDPKLGGQFIIWDGYIKGNTNTLQPYKRIVQSWRTTDFSTNDEDSILEISFEKVNNGTKITLLHSNIPEGQGEDYKKGWKEYYFKPMKKYFAK